MLDRVPPDSNILRERRKGKKTVCILGYAESTRHFAPFDDESVEIWVINEFRRFDFITRWDRSWQIHSRTNFSRINNHNDPLHFEWLKENHGDKRIYMQREWPDIPNGVRYPLEEYINHFGRYCSSSVGFMIGLAIMEGFDRIELFGIEMSSGTEYQYQKANTEYMIGQALGRGLEVYIPPQSSLLKSPLYGYQDMSPGYRMQMELRKGALTKQHDEYKQNWLKQMGAYEVLSELSKEKPDLEPMVMHAFENASELAGQVNQLWGRMEEAQNIINLYDAYPFEQEQSDGTIESIEVERQKHEEKTTDCGERLIEGTGNP